jgi:hypothetical protein
MFADISRECIASNLRNKQANNAAQITI